MEIYLQNKQNWKYLSLLRNYRKKNPEYKIIQCRKSHIARLRDKYLCFKHYTKGKYACECCGEPNYFFFTFDHLDEMGSIHRRETGGLSSGNLAQHLRVNNFPSGIQILCYNCNYAKARCGGICPHKFFDKIKKITLPEKSVHCQTATT